MGQRQYRFIFVLVVVLFICQAVAAEKFTCGNDWNTYWGNWRIFNITRYFKMAKSAQRLGRK